MELGFRIKGVGFRVEGLRFRAEGLGCRVQGLGLRDSRLEFKVEGLPVTQPPDALVTPLRSRNGLGLPRPGFGCRVRVGFGL